VTVGVSVSVEVSVRVGVSLTVGVNESVGVKAVVGVVACVQETAVAVKLIEDTVACSSGESSQAVSRKANASRVEGTEGFTMRLNLL
jgi:hypothetical protein